MKTAYNKAFKAPLTSPTQKWRDTERINLLDIFVMKLNNLTNTEATFEVVSDSAQAEPLKELCKSLEAKRFDITAPMLADGDYYVFPAINSKGELFHSYLTQEQVRILDMDGDNITAADGIIDWYVDDSNRTYYLLREHKLDTNGSLHLSYRTVDNGGKNALLDKWQYLNGQEYVFANANHIGFGRYKSPTNSRGLSPVYGVPLNFGCADIEEDIFEAMEMYRKEHKNAESKIFADPMLLRKNDKEKRYEFAENIFPVQQRAGQSNNVDVYNPAVRETEFSTFVKNLCSRYEKAVGTDSGLLTPFEIQGHAATATEIRRSNAGTIAMLDKIHNALDAGNKMTLEADSVFLNISPELWTYSSDWYDPFEDADSQWSRLLEGKQNGAVETSDLVKWIFPKLTEIEVDEKLERIKQAELEGADQAIERILSGR